MHCKIVIFHFILKPISKLKLYFNRPSPISREFGFSLVGTFPVNIHQIKPASSANEAGINKDDIVTKVKQLIMT